MARESQAFRQPLVGRISQYTLSAADDNGNVLELYVEPIQKFLQRLIAIEIDIAIGMAVAGKEFAQAQRIRRVLRSQHGHVAQASRNHRDTAQKECAHEDIA